MGCTEPRLGQGDAPGPRRRLVRGKPYAPARTGSAFASGLGSTKPRSSTHSDPMNFTQSNKSARVEPTPLNSPR